MSKTKHRRPARGSSVEIDVNGGWRVVRSEHLQEFLLRPAGAAKIHPWRKKQPFIFLALSLRPGLCCLGLRRKVCDTCNFIAEKCQRQARMKSGLNRGSIFGPANNNSRRTFAATYASSPANWIWSEHSFKRIAGRRCCGSLTERPARMRTSRVKLGVRTLFVPWARQIMTIPLPSSFHATASSAPTEHSRVTVADLTPKRNFFALKERHSGPHQKPQQACWKKNVLVRSKRG